MMLDPASVHWATPWGAILILVPLVLAAMSWQRRRKLAAWAEPHLLPWAVASQGGQTGNWRSVVEAIAWLLLTLAAAGPRLPLDDGAADAPGAPRHVMSILVMLDISASMAATDATPNRLQRARLKLLDLTGRLKGERIGLALYAGRAGVLLPPTDDTTLFLRALDMVGTDLIEEAGSNVSAALDVAAAALGTDKSRNRAILMVTDAESDSLTGAARDAARAAAGRLKTAGIPLYVLGVGSATGSPIPLAEGGFAERDGTQVISRTDGPAYADLAQASGGRFVTAGDGGSDWDSLYDQGIATLPGDAVSPDQARAWQALFAWPLGLALLLFTLARLSRWPRRAGASAAAVALALAVVAQQEARAAEAYVHQAHAAYKSERWSEAAQHYARVGGYAGQMGAGAAAWKLKDYGGAARHFGAALLLARTEQQRYDALYNLGNANYGLTRWQAAAEAWRAVLQARPKDENAAANLVRAENQLKKRRDLAPMKTDLRLRAGIAAEAGEINIDWDREGPIQEFEPTPGGPQVDHATATGATLNAEQAAARRAELDARRLQSGLAKLERVEERPRTLIKGLLKQDRPPDAANLELLPW